MRPNLFLGLAAFVLMFLGTSGAEHCTTYSTSDPEIDTTGAGGFFYIDNDLCQPECLFSIWYYEESNNIPGLQRGDEVVDNTCHGMIESDTIICLLLPVGILSPRERKERKANGAALAGVALVGAVAFVPTVDAC